MARKTVKSITINGITGGIHSANPIDGRTTTNGEIAAYGDPLYTTACNPVLHASDVAIDVIDEGSQFAAIKAMVGTTQTITITTSYGDGDGAPTSTTSFTGKAAILAATGDPVAVDDFGRSLIHLTIRKQAEDAAPSGTN